MRPHPFILSILLLCHGCSDAAAGATRDAATDEPELAQPEGRLALSADWLNGSVSIVDFDLLLEDDATREEAVVARVDLGEYAPVGPYSITFTPDGTLAVLLLSEGAGPLLAGLVGIDSSSIPTGQGAVVIFDVATREVIADFPAPFAPLWTAIDAAGERAYVTSLGDGGVGTLSVFDLEGLTKLEEVDVAAYTEGIALSRDGSLGVVIGAAEGLRTFDPVDVAGTLSAPLQLAADSSGVAFVGQQARVVVANSRDPGNYMVLDVSDPDLPAVVEDAPTTGGIPFAIVAVPGTDEVVMSAFNAGGVKLHHLDVGGDTSELLAEIDIPDARTFSHTVNVDPTGRYGLLGNEGDREVMVVDLQDGSVRRIGWLEQPGPTALVVQP